MADVAKIRYGSIRYKFMSIQVLSILLSVVLISAACLLLLTEIYQDLQRDKLEARARSHAAEIGQVIHELSSELDRTNQIDFHLTARAEPLLKEFQRHAVSFPKLAFLNRHGKEVVKYVAGRTNPKRIELGHSLSFQQALLQPNRVLLSLAGHDSDFASPVLIFTQARTDTYNNNLQGVLQATIPLRDFTRTLCQEQGQENVKLILLDAQGRAIIHPQYERLLLPIFSNPQPQQELAALYGSREAGFSQGLVDGEESYYAFSTVPGQTWSALAVVAKSDFRELLNRLVLYCILIGCSGLLIGSLLAHFMGRRILENIQRIKRQTQNLAEGKLDQRVAMASGDELEDLANAVNSLTEKLVQASQGRDSLNLMLQTVVEPLIVTTQDGEIVRVNPAAERMFGTNCDDFIGQHLSRYFAQSSPLADRERLLKMFAQEVRRNHETEIQTVGGSRLPVLFSFAHTEQAAEQETLAVCIFQDISEQKRAEAKVAKLAYYDTLTGLPNRALLHDRLQSIIHLTERNVSGHKHFAVIFLDLDHFKVVNDSLGHSVGDQLLKSAAERLKDCLRRTDTISRAKSDADPQGLLNEHVLARLGGDEFIILLPQLRSTDEAALVARRIIEDMARPFKLDPHEVVTPASIGLAIYPDDGTDSDTLLRCADVAMYHAKEQGRNTFNFFSAEMNESARERLYLKHRLRNDIEAGTGFRLAYQPKVDLQTNQVCGMEVLVRWQHKDLGDVSPGRFIPIAEESGLIVPLGRWILETACQQLRDWIEAGAPRMHMAVNLSGRQLKQPDLIPMVAEILEQTGLDPELLELELTESMLMETVEKTIGLMNGLRDLGVSLAIDDFGTGYSSLSYLKRFPIDTLKIDRSFVRDLEADKDDAAIVQAIVAMAKSLQLGVVAEGVETEPQLEFLRKAGANQYQGFLFSKPVFGNEFEERFL